ncbi:hypothetical protein NP233_g12768 [Leucocoprinus birnbaumii]|uniref:Uncharacterized protein n=1 Tax=Leucocoprinus birnbaumii TaxID=56174 RepID=A0AAD5VDT6_9AGAR|nr:hypothetical protein NP233_g12768 [Leucocoprinus birnbaumii]
MVKSCTSHEIYHVLCKMYAKRDWVGGKEIWDSLNTVHSNGNLQQYCTRWKSNFGHIQNSVYREHLKTTVAITTFFKHLSSAGPILLSKAEALRMVARN